MEDQKTDYDPNEDHIKSMNIKEFREKGFLQEVNRLFFHPLGLALEVEVDWPENITEEEKSKYDSVFDHPNASCKLGGIWDYTDDPEGMLFGQNMINKDKIKFIESLRQSKKEIRAKLKICNEEGIQIE